MKVCMYVCRLSEFVDIKCEKDDGEMERYFRVSFTNSWRLDIYVCCGVVWCGVVT